MMPVTSLPKPYNSPLCCCLFDLLRGQYPPFRVQLPQLARSVGKSSIVGISAFIALIIYRFLKYGQVSGLPVVGGLQEHIVQ